MAEDETMAREPLSPAVLSAGMAAILLLSAAAGVQAFAVSGHPLASQSIADQARRSVVWIGYPASAPAAFRVDSASVDAPAPDDYQITYNHGSFSLAYEQKAGGPVTSQFTVTVATLVEWVPMGDGTFSDGLLVGYEPLGAPAFGKLPIVHSQTTTSAGTVVHSFLIQSNSGEITLNLTIAQGFVSLAPGSTLTPMEAELTFEVNHLMNRTDTRLSLQLSLTADTAGQQFSLNNESWDAEHAFNQDERAVNVTNNSGPTPSSAFFAWSNHAQINGVEGEVGVTGLEFNETTGGYDLYLSYPRTSPTTDQIEVIHDPALGVVSAAYASILNRAPTPGGIQPDIPLYAVTVVAMAGLVAGTVFLTRRQRKQRQ